MDSSCQQDYESQEFDDYVKKIKTIALNTFSRIACFPKSSYRLAVRKCKFLTKFKLSSNILCRTFADIAELELLSCMSAVNS